MTHLLIASKFRLVPVGADVFEVKRRNACPVCVWGLPKPIRGHYFREDDGKTQRKEDCDVSRELLRKMLIKQNTDKKRGIGWRIRKRRP